MRSMRTNGPGTRLHGGGGVCGKTPKVAALQDLLLYAVRGLSLYAHAARKRGLVDPEVNRFTVQALFSTVTNVDFDPERFVILIKRAVELRDGLAQRLAAAGVEPRFEDAAASFQPAADGPGMVRQGEEEVKTAFCLLAFLLFRY